MSLYMHKQNGKVVVTTFPYFNTEPEFYCSDQCFLRNNSQKNDPHISSAIAH